MRRRSGWVTAMVVGGTVSCGAEIAPLEEAPDLGALAEPVLDPSRPLPAAQRHVVYTMNSESSYWVGEDRQDVPGPSSVALIVGDDAPLSFRAWCVDLEHSMGEATIHHGRLFSSYEPLPQSAHLAHPEHLGAANFLLNAHPVGTELWLPDAELPVEITDDDLQAALWSLLASNLPDGFLPSGRRPLIDAMTTEALTEGSDFVPGPRAHGLLLLIGEEIVDGQLKPLQTQALDATVPEVPPVPRADGEAPETR